MSNVSAYKGAFLATLALLDGIGQGVTLTNAGTLAIDSTAGLPALADAAKLIAFFALAFNGGEGKGDPVSMVALALALCSLIGSSLFRCRVELGDQVRCVSLPAAIRKAMSEVVLSEAVKLPADRLRDI